MALDTDMETYLSLAAVLIMCVPGITFIFSVWRKSKFKRTRNLRVLPIREDRTWPSISFYDAILHHPPASQYPINPQAGTQLAFDRLGIRSTPNVNCAELVGDP